MAGPVLEYLDLTLNSALERAASLWPRRVFLKIGGAAITFGDFDDAVERLANGLQELGLQRGGRLVVFMGNSLECLHTWFAACRLGAVWVPLNTEFRGATLRQLLELATASIYVCDAPLLRPFLDQLGELSGKTILISQTGITEADGFLPLSRYYRTGSSSPVRLDPSDLAAFLCTSGTTGRSKAAMLSHRYFVSQASIAIRAFGLREDDVLYCPFPLFHSDATALTTVPALLIGACAAISPRFSASRFWSEIRGAGATVFDFMGATLSILNKAEPKPDDADNTVRLAWGVPVPEWVRDFEERFDLQVVELYGSVESNIPVTQGFDQARIPGSCGRPIPEFDVIVADARDQEQPRGLVGEILVRPKIPFTMLSGYSGMEAAMVGASRNFWWHTGDLGRMDSEGNLFFVGRSKDVIRRRGENISAFEVEEGVLLHPGIRECAAIGVPSELTEEDLKICVILQADSRVSELEIWEHCRSVLARFQVPRYVEILESLPTTPTGKIEKYVLRAHALTPKTWDQQTGGYVRGLTQGAVS